MVLLWLILAVLGASVAGAAFVEARRDRKATEGTSGPVRSAITTRYWTMLLLFSVLLGWAFLWAMAFVGTISGFGELLELAIGIGNGVLSAIAVLELRTLVEQRRMMREHPRSGVTHRER